MTKDQKTKLAVTIGIVAVFLFVGGKELVGNMFNSNTQDQQMQNQQQPQGQVQIKDVTEGTGDVALPGKEVTVNYIGVFSDGTKFDSSYDRNQPFTFKLGAGQVIKGWDIGVEGMKVGGKRILIIPPELGYGSQAYQTIPANSTLIFQVELLGVK
jgi:FKBP-type peptidyl-prolyl cis-trans isomerase